MTSVGTAPQATTTRTVSRKLLRRVAARIAEPLKGECLEDIFPTAPAPADLSAPPSKPQLAVALAAATQLPPAAVEGSVAPSGASTHVPAALPSAAPSWSSEDEAALQALTARRKTAGYPRRGKTVGVQTVRAGTITPNPDTIVAVIVKLVSEQKTMARAELVTAMTAASFPHPKARPTDPSWCQGYIAGALRNGFLALADEPTVAASAAG